MALLDLIVTFSAFTLAGSVALMLLPDGSVRRAVTFAFGVTSLMLWLQGLFSLELPAIDAQLLPMLFESSAGLPDAASTFAECERLLSERASSAAGCDATVSLDDKGRISSLVLEPCSEEAARLAAEAVGADASQITYAGR